MSDIAFRHPHNPDVMYSGCQVTGLNEEGVSFPTVEPADGTVMFVGKTALIEAVAELYGISPEKAKFRLEDRPSPRQAQLDKVQAELDKVKAKLARFEELRDAMEQAGMILTTFED